MGETVQYTALAILGLAVFQGMGIIKEHTIMKLKYEEAEDLHRHVRREIRDLKEVVTQGD